MHQCKVPTEPRQSDCEPILEEICGARKFRKVYTWISEIFVTKCFGVKEKSFEKHSKLFIQVIAFDTGEAIELFVSLTPLYKLPQANS